jgi:hypothetical protein
MLQTLWRIPTGWAVGLVGLSLLVEPWKLLTLQGWTALAIMAAVCSLPQIGYHIWKGQPATGDDAFESAFFGPFILLGGTFALMATFFALAFVAYTLGFLPS